MSLEVQDGRGPLCTLSNPSSWLTHKHQFSIQKKHTHIHTPTGASELYSSSLDDVVKQLHGLHDVLVLEKRQADQYPSPNVTCKCIFNCRDLLLLSTATSLSRSWDWPFCMTQWTHRWWPPRLYSCPFSEERKQPKNETQYWCVNIQAVAPDLEKALHVFSRGVILHRRICVLPHHVIDGLHDVQHLLKRG